jgi:hypothetical protein
MSNSGSRGRPCRTPPSAARSTAPPQGPYSPQACNFSFPILLMLVRIVSLLMDLCVEITGFMTALFLNGSARPVVFPSPGFFNFRVVCERSKWLGLSQIPRSSNATSNPLLVMSHSLSGQLVGHTHNSFSRLALFNIPSLNGLSFCREDSSVCTKKKELSIKVGWGAVHLPQTWPHWVMNFRSPGFVLSSPSPVCKS